MKKKPAPKKPKNRRASKKYPALDPKFNLKTRWSLIEADYLHKLNDEEKAWLNKFNEEFVNASFSKDNDLNLQKEDWQRKESYNRNNARNRCVLTRALAQDKAPSWDAMTVKPRQEYDHEGELIAKLDLEKRIKEFVDSDDGPSND